MRKIFVVFSLLLVLFIGCTQSDNESKITIGDGVSIEKKGEILTVVSQRPMLSACFELSGEVYENSIVVSDQYLSIIQDQSGKLYLYVAALQEKEENIKFDIIDMNNGSISLLNYIDSNKQTNIEKEISVKKGSEILLGDFDKNNEVGLSDFNVLKTNFGQESVTYDIGPAAKGTGDWENIYCILYADQKVGLEDLTVFAANFMKKAPGESTEIEVSKVEISIENTNIKIGDSINALVEISPANATDKTITWEISDENIIDLNVLSGEQQATLTALTTGQAILTVTSVNDKQDSIVINITEKINVTGITVHAQYTSIWAWNKNGVAGDVFDTWPGASMTAEANGWYTYTFANTESINVILSNGGSSQTGDLSISEEGEYWYNGSKLVDYNPDVDITAPNVNLGMPADKLVDGVNCYEDETINLTLDIIDDQDIAPKAYYTLDGTPASIQSVPYIEGSMIQVTGEKTLNVFTIDNENNSAVYIYKFLTGVDCTKPIVAANPPAGRYETSQKVILSVTDENGIEKIYYTKDGTEPTTDSDIYTNSVDITVSENKVIKVLAIDTSGNETKATFRYYIGDVVESTREDFREETVYFLMTARFYDGDLSNTRVSPSYESSGNSQYDDPSWRGDFKGLIEKLDYIKALGFTAIWITPPVLNRNYYDYHGYHAWDLTRIDGRLESPGATYQDLIDEVHARDMKIIQDIVLNHSGRYGFKDQCEVKYFGDPDAPGWGTIPGGNNNDYIDYYDEYNPDFEYDGVSVEPNSGKSWYNGDLWQKEKPEFDWEPAEEYYWWNGQTYTHENDLDNLWGVKSPYSSPEGYPVYHFQWPGMYESQFTLLDPDWFHRFWLKNWEDYTCQFGTIHEDCLDLNTESEVVQKYLIDSYGEYIKMGVDGFRVDTVKHISRNTLNRRYNPAFHEIAESAGKKGFYMAGEVCVRDHGVWNKGNVALSQPFYTWKERTTYSADDLIAAKEAYDYELGRGSNDQPTSDNHLLNGNEYHTPDYSQFSGMNVIDFRMHWNFGSANTAFGIKDGDKYTNDATWNMTYVESHDYSPLEVGNSLYARMTDADAMAENWTLMFTWRGIPTIFYGNEILFKAGEIIDEGPNRALENSGRAYFGDHIDGDVSVSDFGEYTNVSGEMKNTLEHPLAQHLIRLNKIRRSIPALQKGQYSTEGITGAMAFKRRYTDEEKGIDSFVLVTVSGDAEFTGIPNGTYVDAITGDQKNVSNGNLNVLCSGKGNARIYVLDLPGNPAPGKIGEAGEYLK